jgi:Cytochrome c554 and c-prime
MEHQPQLPPPPTAPRLPISPPRTVWPFALLVVCLLLFGGGYALVRWGLGNGQAAVDPPAASQSPKLFIGWTKPDFALVITGQLDGYLQPCGCSDPQYGGLARRYEFIHELTKKGWRVVPLDVGDLFPKNSDTPSAQNLLKYETAMRALHAMGYHAVGIGKQELTAPLTTALGAYSLNNPRPRPIAANLTGTETDGIFNAMNVRPFEIIHLDGLPKIGVVGMIGKTVQDAVKTDPNLKFDRNGASAALKELAKQKTDFNVVLFQSDEKFAPGAAPEVETCTDFCQKQNLAPLHVVLHTYHDPEPPGLPKVLNGTQLISVGHKGKYVGVLGVWHKQGGGFDYKYEMVLIGPEYEPKTPNPVSKLMEDYSQRVMKQNFLDKFQRTAHPMQVMLKGDGKYIGSERCGDCHQHAHNIWQNTPHAKAFQGLANAKDPGLRQFDGECLQCHTTGFKHDWGYNDPRVKAQPKLQAKLLDVGCESCHGPGSAHANNPKDMDIRKLINPWAQHFNKNLPAQARLQKIDNFCQNCHDIENDVHWQFAKRWPVVIHMNPPENPNPAPKKK